MANGTNGNQRNGNGNGNGNGTISSRTKVPLSLGIPLAAFIVTVAGWVARVETHLAIDEKDPFRGADADRLLGRIQWAWQDLAQRQHLPNYPRVPPWRQGSEYQPSIIRVEEDDE